MSYPPRQLIQVASFLAQSFTLALTIICVEAVLPSNSMALEIGELIASPSAYDGKQVTVSGIAPEPRLNESRGKPFTIFDLSDRRGRSVRVFSWGHLTFRQGALVSVDGTFLKEKPVGEHTIHNEIEAGAVHTLSDPH